MSYANGTEHYNLPQTVGTDKRDWFDTNSAFAAIDAALYAAATGQAADAEAISTINGQITTIQGNITSLQGTVGNHTTQIGALQTSVSGLTNTVADVRQDAEDMISAYNEGAAETSTHAYVIGDYFIYNDVLYKATASIAIGDTIVPNTNCQATNVTTEIKAVEASIPADKVGDLADLTTTDKSSAVAAINEVNSALVGESIEATILATDTYGTMLDKIENLIDYDKVTPQTTLSIADNSIVVHLQSALADRAIFSLSQAGVSGPIVSEFVVRNGNCAYLVSTGSTRSDNTSTTVPAGYANKKVTLRY